MPRFAACCAVLLAILLLSFSVPVSAKGEGDTALADRLIVPGERIGRLRLAGTLSDITSILGMDAERQRGTGIWQSTTSYDWTSDHVRVIADDATSQVLWISVSVGGSQRWEAAATREGLGIGATDAQLLAVLGAPSRQFSDGVGKSLYFDRRGIRFFFATTGPATGRVVAVRVVWPHTMPGDGLIVPGERISSVTLRMTLDEVISTLGGGYTKQQVGENTAYAWLHRGLRILTKDQRMLSIGAFSTPFLEGAGVKYATADGLGIGSSDTQVRERLGEPSDQSEQGRVRWWIYRANGLAFGLDPQAQVALIEVIPGQPWIAPLLSLVAAIERSVARFESMLADAGVNSKVFWFVAVLLFLFLWLPFQRRVLGERRAAYHQVAIRLGMKFAQTDESLNEEAFMSLPLLQKGIVPFKGLAQPIMQAINRVPLIRNWGFSLGPIRNVLRGQHNGVDVVLFEHTYPKGEDSVCTQEVAAFRLPARNLPQFQLSPERTLDKIASALGGQDIDFDSRPNFSEKYRLRGADESAVRKLFQPQALDYFSGSEGWSVEGQGEWLIIYKNDVRVPPANLGQFLENTSRISRLFLIGKERFAPSTDRSTTGF